MVKYSCKRCGKAFSQKSHYDSHNKRKTSCENNADKIKDLVDKAVEEKFKELNNKKLIVNNEDVNVNTEVMQTTGLKRKTIDKFYTSPIIVNECMKLIKQKINIQETDLCIEPSAGNGSFINGIKSLFNHHKFYDLEPENDEIIKQDYLEYDYTTIIKEPNSKVHVIGNPPFGRQSSLAIKFIKKSCEYCDSVSFILPKSFKKDSLKKHYPPNFHLIYEYDLPNNSFIVDKKEYDVPCVFQIWIKKNQNRTIKKKNVESNFKFIKKEIINIDNDIYDNVKILFDIDQQNSNKKKYDFEKWKSKFIINSKLKEDTIIKRLNKKLGRAPNISEISNYKNRKTYERFDDFGDSCPDISFRRVGINAGSISKNIEEKSFQSHYFIKFDILLTDELFDKLVKIDSNEKNNTVGPKSISTQELIKEFNKVF